MSGIVNMCVNGDEIFVYINKYLHKSILSSSDKNGGS